MYNVLYTKEGAVFIVPNHYGHSLQVIKDILSFARTVLEVEVPDDDKVNIQVLAGDRWSGIMSVEFNIPEITNTLKAYKESFLLTPDSGLWRSLKY